MVQSSRRPHLVAYCLRFVFGGKNERSLRGQPAVVQSCGPHLVACCLVFGGGGGMRLKEMGR